MRNTVSPLRTGRRPLWPYSSVFAVSRKKICRGFCEFFAKFVG